MGCAQPRRGGRRCIASERLAGASAGRAAAHQVASSAHDGPLAAVVRTTRRRLSAWEATAMAWWAWMLLAWATLATVGVLVLSAALYERADHIRALTIDEEWPQDRPDHYTWPEPVDLGGYTDGGRPAERPAQA